MIILPNLPKITMETHVENAVDYILTRNEDGNLLNESLNELESELFIKLSGQNCASGEDAMDKYQEEVRDALITAITSVAEKYKLIKQNKRCKTE